MLQENAHPSADGRMLWGLFKPFVVRLLTDTKAFSLLFRMFQENAHPSADGRMLWGLFKPFVVRLLTDTKAFSYSF